MSAPEFLDTNILVYSYDASDPRKQRIARELVRKAVLGEIVTSTQVLAEFSSIFLHKISPPISAKDVTAMLDALNPIKTVATDSDMVRRAVKVSATFRIHFYDAMIVAAAERCGTLKIWSEDLNPGQSYLGIRVENPFGGTQT